MSDRSGLVEAIYLAEIHGAMPHEVEVATAYAGRGLEGDRNFDDDGPDSCNITLIEAEAFDSFDLPPAQSRRQVLVRGVNLGDFIGRRFRIAVRAQGFASHWFESEHPHRRHDSQGRHGPDHHMSS